MPILLQINTVINSGSTGRIAEEIGQVAISQGWQSYIAFGRNGRVSESIKLKIGSDFDIKLHGLQTRFFDRHGFASKKATIALIAQIKRINPDIIHLHNIHGYYLNYPLLFNYLSASNIKVVWTLHDCWPFTGHCCYFSFIGCDRWKDECYDCPQKKHYPSSLWLDRSKKNYHDKKIAFGGIKELTMVPVSDWLADITQQSFLGSKRIHCIYNGIDTDIFSPKDNREQILKRYNIDSRFLIIGIASIWDNRKGLKDFIALSKGLPDNIQILLVGLTEKQIKGLPDNIIGITRTENTEQLAEIYSAADLFINPTWEDNFPTTNLESLACGTPVVTYRTGGSVEAVTPKTGFIVEQGDIKGLLSTIDIVREKGKSFYSAACRERALANFRKEDRYAEYIELYNELLKTK